MQAVLVTAPGELSVADVPVPPRNGGALIRVLRAGICGTDTKVFKGAIPVEYPRVMGHEVVGTVVEAADGGRLPVGTRVMVNPATACGYCDLCRRGLDHLCRNGGLLGREEDGVFAEYVVAPEQRLHVIPDAVSEDAAALVQVLGTVVHAQRSIAVFPDQTAVVVGLGVSGLLHLQMLLARGVGTVIGVTRSQSKLDLAAELGATATAVPADAAALVAELTGGRGADIVVESVGREATLAQSIELAGHAADVVVFGTLTGGGEGLPYYQLYFKELTLHNPRAARADDYDTGIALTAAGKLRLEPLLTSRHPLADAAAAFAALGERGNLKVVMEGPA
jgi:2-desacetyl-2-hydroxyethyl bacteriochlorophyllide A dehydrogenase